MPVTGSSVTYEQAVHDHFTDLYRFAYWMCRNRWQAEDLAQEALLRAWRGWPALREERAVKAWLFTIVHREFQRANAKSARAEPVHDADELSVDRDPAPAVDMERALRELPDASRAALLMQVLGGFSCSEISAALGASEGAVMTRLTRARQALRRRLEVPDTFEIKQR